MERERRTEAQRRGAAAEAAVVDRLAAAGWRVLGRNLRVGRAELDVLAVDPGPPPTLVAVEVRFRSRRDFGLAEESVRYRKRALLHEALGRLRERGSLADGTVLPRLVARVDLVVVEPAGAADEAVTIRHHRHLR